MKTKLRTLATNVVDSLGAHPLFRNLPREVLEQIVKSSRVECLDPGEVMYLAGNAADRVYAIIEGALQIEFPKPNEQRGMVKVILPAPGFLGEAQVFHGRTWSGTGVAMSPLTAVALTKEMLETLVIEHPRFGLVLYQELTGRFLRALENWKVERVLEPHQMLARYLWSYSEVSGPKDAMEVCVSLSQAELGRVTDLSRETINRVLRSWEDQKIVRLEKARVWILAKDKLQDLAGPALCRGLIDDQCSEIGMRC